jgi:hemerythrin
MTRMHWREDYSVNIISIDQQHRRMIDLINQLHDAVRTNQEKKTLGSVLSQLFSYTKNHFKTEEALMRAYKYPALESHKVEHQILVKRVTDFRKKFETGTLTDAFDLVNFLMGWLEGHILGTDKKYSPFLVGKGVR